MYYNNKVKSALIPNLTAVFHDENLAEFQQ